MRTLPSGYFQQAGGSPGSEITGDMIAQKGGAAQSILSRPICFVFGVDF